MDCMGTHRGRLQAWRATAWLQFGVIERIVWAWILTIPAAAIMSAISYWILRAVVPFQF